MEDVSFPLKYKIKIDFCREKKKFYFSTPISRAISPAIRSYIEARKTHTFKPHATSFHVDDNAIVRLVQEIPFYWGAQLRFREQMVQYWRLVKRCHRILSEIAVEERYENARSLEY